MIDILEQLSTKILVLEDRLRKLEVADVPLTRTRQRDIGPFDTDWVGTSGEPLTSPSYDGNDTITPGTTTIDTSSVFSIPAGVLFVDAYIRATWASASGSSNLQIKLTGDSNVIAELKAHDTLAQSMTVRIPCDGNGDFDVVVLNANATNVIIVIISYTIEE